MMNVEAGLKTRLYPAAGARTTAVSTGAPVAP